MIPPPFFNDMRPCELPAGGIWTLKQYNLYENVFLVATNPEHEPRLIGRTATGQLFTRLLTDMEKGLVST